MYILYFTLGSRCKPEYISAVWNSIASTDADKLERIQQKFSALCFNRVFSQVHYTRSYAYALEQLKLHALRKRNPPYSSLPWF
jgi:hypothetical protein